MRKIFWGFICVSIISISCNSERSKKKGPLELVKVDSLVLRPDTANLFGTFYENFKINNTGDRLAFYDRIKEKIFLFDDEGKFINAIGEYGKGLELLQKNGQ